MTDGCDMADDRDCNAEHPTCKPCPSRKQCITGKTDDVPRDRDMIRKWIIWYAIAMHFCYGVAVLIAGQAYMTTAIAGVSKYLSAWQTGLLFVGVSALACRAMFHESRGWRHLLLLIPQQLVMMYSAMGALIAMAHCQFADGVPRPFGFIFVDQCPIVLSAIFHTAALLEHHAGDMRVNEWRVILRGLFRLPSASSRLRRR